MEPPLHGDVPEDTCQFQLVREDVLHYNSLVLCLYHVRVDVNFIWMFFQSFFYVVSWMSPINVYEPSFFQ